MPQAEHDLTRAHRQIGPSIDPDHTRRVAECRDLPEKLGQDVLTGNQQLDRLDAGGQRSLDQILAFGGEQPGLGPVLLGSEKLPDEPELLVLTRLDQAACDSDSASSAAFARSATAAKARGSLTAMSASDLRSSSIPAFFTPAMNRL